MQAMETADEIERILLSETDASRLSRRLFDADGLFGQLARTEPERQALAQTPLFRRSLSRLTELQRKEADAYRQSAPPLVSLTGSAE